ncbi:MAG: protease modulator HflC [Verrucomicrobiota bacterium]|jgi:membrane protease subunit HflC|nr:protease modulator HflC [Verrucomicrobiota bacterium]
MVKQFTSVFIGILLFILAVTFFSSVYIVDETKQVFVTQFGKITRDPLNGPGKDQAGPYFRVPFITEVHAFEKRYLEWDGAPNQVTTKDKLFIHIDTYARWRIVDAKLLYERVKDEDGAKKRLNGILDGAARNVVAANDLVEVIRSQQREAVVDETEVLDDESQLKPFMQGRSALAKHVLDNAGPNLKEEFGIELLDFRFKRINYTADVRLKIYERMISERARIANKFRSEGEGEAAKIMGAQQRELKTIESGAYLQQQQIKGEADANAVAIYAEAFDQSPESREFYEFLKTMETLESTLSKDDTLIFSTDSDFFRYLKRSAPNKE